MSDEQRAFAEDLGRQLQHLVDLAGDEDPTGLLLFEELDRLSEDDAKALLAAAALRMSVKA